MELFLKSRYEYIKSSFSVHQRHVISLLIHSFLPVNARLLIEFCTAFYAIITVNTSPLTVRFNFHTFTCTNNIAMCWETDPQQRSSVFKSKLYNIENSKTRGQTV